MRKKEPRCTHLSLSWHGALLPTTMTRNDFLARKTTEAEGDSPVHAHGKPVEVTTLFISTPKIILIRVFYPKNSNSNVQAHLWQSNFDVWCYNSKAKLSRAGCFHECGLILHNTYLPKLRQDFAHRAGCLQDFRMEILWTLLFAVTKSFFDSLIWYVNPTEPG